VYDRRNCLLPQELTPLLRELAVLFSILGDLNVPALVQLKYESTEREDKGGTSGIQQRDTSAQALSLHELIQSNCLRFRGLASAPGCSFLDLTNAGVSKTLLQLFTHY
jgi:hypothetical protein